MATSDAEHLLWLRDRLVNVYKEDSHVDYIWRLERIILREMQLLTVLGYMTQGNSERLLAWLNKTGKGFKL